MITKADQPRLNYDYEQKLWYLITPVVLSHTELVKTVAFCKSTYEKRIKGEGNPMKRKRMSEAVQLLSPASVKQFMIGAGEKVLFHSDKL